MKAPRRGFTLIELLVVIAIISILASILFPVFARARAKGRQTACLSNVKQLVMAFIMYANDSDETMPYGGPTPDNLTAPLWTDAEYLSVQPPSGQIPKNGSYYVPIQIVAASSSQLKGLYHGTITFTATGSFDPTRKEDRQKSKPTILPDFAVDIFVVF